MNVPVVKLSSNAKIPARQTDGASGYDLHALTGVSVEPGEIEIVRTGIAIAIPRGYEGQIRPRSGLALRYGVTVANTPGTIDSDYRGEIKVMLCNRGGTTYACPIGTRIAQLVIAPVVYPDLVECDDLPCSDRADGGFGSTGDAG